MFQRSWMSEQQKAKFDKASFIAHCEFKQEQVEFFSSDLYQSIYNFAKALDKKGLADFLEKEMCNVDIINGDQTPCSQLASEGNKEAANLLVEFGADVGWVAYGLEKRKNFSPMLECLSVEPDVYAIFKAVISQDIPLFGELLAKDPSDDKLGSLDFAMSAAALTGHKTLFDKLSEYRVALSGGSKYFANRSFLNPVTLAAMGGHIRLTENLMLFYRRSYSLNRAIMGAAMGGHIQFTKRLLQGEPSSHLAIAMMGAVCCKHKKLMDELKLKGAELDLPSFSYNAAVRGDITLLTLVLMVGGNPDDAVMAAGLHGQKQILKLMIDRKEAPDYLLRMGIYYTAKGGFKDLTDQLISLVDDRDINKALSAAARGAASGGRHHLVYDLISRGADKDIAICGAKDPMLMAGLIARGANPQEATKRLHQDGHLETPDNTFNLLHSLYINLHYIDDHIEWWDPFIQAIKKSRLCSFDIEIVRLVVENALYRDIKERNTSDWMSKVSLSLKLPKVVSALNAYEEKSDEKTQLIDKCEKSKTENDLYCCLSLFVENLIKKSTRDNDKLILFIARLIPAFFPLSKSKKSTAPFAVLFKPKEHAEVKGPSDIVTAGQHKQLLS